MRSMTATLLSVFREVRVYRPDPNTVVFLASDQPLNPELQLAQTGYPLRSAPLHYARFGINNTEDLLAALVLDAEGARRISAGAPLITDDDNRIATSSVYEHRRGMTGESSGRFVAALDPLQRADSIAYGALKDHVSFDYIARRISVFSMLDASLSDRVAMRIGPMLISSSAAGSPLAAANKVFDSPIRTAATQSGAVALASVGPGMRPSHSPATIATSARNSGGTIRVVNTCARSITA
jgi:hypothetical protein